MTTFNKPKPTKRVPVEVPRLEEWRRLVSGATARIHSNAHMSREDKVAVLGILAKIRKGLDDHIQLKLFSDSQLDFGD